MMCKVEIYEALQWAWLMLRECETVEEGRDRIASMLGRIGGESEDVDFRPGIDRMMGNLEQEGGIFGVRP